MARLIKETPTLRGKDAERFRKDMEAIKKVPPKRMVEMQANYKKMLEFQADGVLGSLEEASQIHAGKMPSIPFNQFLNEL